MPREGNTNPLFGPSGSLYVYLVYGSHLMRNVVAGDIGYPAVL